MDGGLKTASVPASSMGIPHLFVAFRQKHVLHLVSEEAGGGGGGVGGCVEEEQVEGGHSQLGGGG